MARVAMVRDESANMRRTNKVDSDLRRTYANNLCRVSSWYLVVANQ